MGRKSTLVAELRSRGHRAVDTARPPTAVADEVLRTLDDLRSVPPGVDGG